MKSIKLTEIQSVKKSVLLTTFIRLIPFENLNDFNVRTYTNTAIHAIHVY
jgi:hypothetical protein